MPVHNRIEHTRAFVGCLRKQSFQDYHLLLIDDGSRDGTADMVISELTRVSVIRGDGNWWWAGSLQKGVEWLVAQEVADSDLVLIINDDSFIDEGFLQTAVDILDDPGVTLLLPQAYCRESGKLIDCGVHVDWRRLKFDPPGSLDEVNCLSTRGLFLSMGTFRRIGGFHPRLLPHYLSDYEFTIRAQRKGCRLVCDPRLKLWMDNNSTGYHTVRDETFTGFCRKFFSNKCAMNPLYWAAFVVLACPWRWKPKNLQRIVFRGVKSVVRRRT